jgi:spermidine/putrescine transport system permease protein
MESATAAAPASAVTRPAHARAWAWLRRNAIMIYAGFAIAYLQIPILVIGVYSFAVGDPAKGTINFSLENGFTTEYWQNAFSRTDLNDSLLTSLRLAGLSTLIATSIGTLMAMALVRYQFRGRKASNLLIVLPMATPEIVIGSSLLSLFIVYGIARGFNTLLIAHVMFSISFVVVVVRSRLIGFDRSIEEAAADLGASPLQTFRYVTLPLLAPAIMAGALLAFALSIDDFVISYFNAGATETFPLWIYGVAQRGIPVQANVVATLLFLVTIAAIMLVIWQQRRAEKLASVRPDPEV